MLLALLFKNDVYLEENEVLYWCNGHYSDFMYAKICMCCIRGQMGVLKTRWVDVGSLRFFSILGSMDSRIPTKIEIYIMRTTETNRLNGGIMSTVEMYITSITESDD